MSRLPAAALLAVTAACARPGGVELRDGRLYVDGEHRFLKIGKPLRDFADPAACGQLIRDLPILAAKGYNALELNCYWHHFERDGDGRLDRSAEPLARLIEAIAAAGMFPCLSVETYGVGGGQIPPGFWERHPEALAINSDGKPVSDTEYGFGSAVPSLYDADYLAASRAFIANLTQALPHERILYFETTVEPQYIGNQAIDYGPAARAAYEAWLARTGADGPAWPEGFPVPAEFVEHPVWNQFRAEYLAGWVNGDAAAFRSVAGDDAWIAVDYLETCGGEMRRRNGDSATFLRHLGTADIIQVNWHWHLGRRAPNQCAYDHVRAIMAETGRDWAISEHMTFNGSDYRPDEAEAMLRNTLAQGTRFGWEFVSVSPSSADAFSLYHDDWSPKPLIAVVDERWQEWLEAAQ